VSVVRLRLPPVEETTPSPDVSVVVVTYRCQEEARRCLASLYERTKGVSFEVIVLDNDSGDGTAEMVEREFPQAMLIALRENVGFGPGVNRAAAYARGEYVLLLNPDTIVHEGAVESLVEFARARPGPGLYGGRTLQPDGTLDPGSCWGAPSLWSLTCFATLLSTIFKGSRFLDPESLGGWQRDTVRAVDIVTGCLLLLERELWRSLGGFDPRFFMYGEDADLALRAAAAGIPRLITPNAVVTHEVGASSATRPDKLVLLFQGKATLLRKHWRPVRRELGVRLLLLGVGVRALAARIMGAQRDDRATAYPAVWSARSEWLDGYPEPAMAETEEAAPRLIA
jgi:N-acetylglucosaminyl-diphospho-decaprenol L-rhamnosyltransferase